MKYYNHKESGVVSIFSVIFFMIFVSVLAVSFVKVMTDEQRQATDNDLTSSALASARSGAEDGKRALLLCKRTTVPSEQVACATALSSTACNGVTGQSALRSALDINSPDGTEAVVSGNTNYQQYYTCLSIQRDTNSVDGVKVDVGKSQIIPIKTTSPITSLDFSWHEKATDGTPSLTGITGANPSVSQPNWAANKWPGMMRLEFIAYPRGGQIDLNSIDATTKTIFLAPGPTTGATVAGLTDDRTSTTDSSPRATAAATPVNVKCDPNADYVCKVKIAGLSPGSDYYLRVSAMYAGARISMQPFNNATQILFNDVQPIIDVTGRANDVFRRIQTRVMYQNDFFMPEYALESSAPICKSMTVTNATATSSDACNP